MNMNAMGRPMECRTEVINSIFIFIFIVNGIIHDVLSSAKKDPVMLQQYDYRQMFDAIYLEEALSDIYVAGLKDDNPALLYGANKKINIAVNTPSGLSERENMET